MRVQVEHLLKTLSDLFERLIFRISIEGSRLRNYKKEPQNIEQGITNDEVSLIIRIFFEFRTSFLTRRFFGGLKSLESLPAVFVAGLDPLNP